MEKDQKKLDSSNEDYEGYILSDLFFSTANVEIIQRQIVLNFKQNILISLYFGFHKLNLFNVRNP